MKDDSDDLIRDLGMNPDEVEIVPFVVQITQLPFFGRFQLWVDEKTEEVAADGNKEHPISSYAYHGWAFGPFDDAVLPVRTLPLTRPRSSNTAFKSWLDATDTSLPIGQRKDKYLFPRYFGSIKLNAQTLPAMSDLQLVLDKSLAMFKAQPGYEVSDNFVVLFTDGFCNCVSGAPPLASGGKCFTSMQDSLLPVTQEYVRQCLIEMRKISTKFRENKVTLSIVLLGDEVLPHSLLRKGSNGCLSDLDSRGIQPTPPPMVDPTGGTLDPKDDIPYPFPNYLFYEARYASGLWVPVMDCCRDAAGNCLDISNPLNQICRDAPGNLGDLLTCSNSGLPALCAYQNDNHYVDTSGRLLCNMEGKTKKKQVQEAMDDIMKRNPFVLVE